MCCGEWRRTYEDLRDGRGLSQGFEQKLEEMGDDKQARDLRTHGEDGIEKLLLGVAIPIGHLLLSNGRD